MLADVASLNAHLDTVIRLGQAGAVLEWDMQTNMPPGGIEARAAQSAALSRLGHEIFTSEQTRTLLEAAERAVANLEPEHEDRRLVAVVRRNFDQSVKLPTDLVAELSSHSSLSHDAWVTARKENDFAAFAPYLEKMVGLTRRKAEALGYTDHVYDPLLDSFEPGTTTAEISALFADLKPRLIGLAKRIAEKPAINDFLLRKHYPIDRQRDLTLKVVTALGYDLERGRQDVAAHPFCTTFSRNDVRITTKFLPNLLSTSLYSSMHEAGHAMYEQGSSERFEGTFLAGGASMGIHESQSRLWENLVGRSRPFSEWIHPTLTALFPEQFSGSSPEDLYRAVNRAELSPIRIEADEATYNLHIILRFELECDLLSGALSVKDLPEAWNARMREYFGITPDSNANGVLQDVHWSSGYFGYFPTYTLGNLLASQLWECIAAEMPGIDANIRQGDFLPLLSWLRERVHQYGSLYLPKELARKATGKPLGAEPFMKYLERKFGDLYGL